MSDTISTKKVLGLLAGMVAEIINTPPERMEERTETHTCDNERTETHGDLISRKAAIDFIDAGHLCNPNELRWSDNDVVNFLKKRPSAEPERKTGRWIHIRTEPDGNALYECSECHKGEVHVPIVEVHYCWNCGARMEGESE